MNRRSRSESPHRRRRKWKPIYSKTRKHTPKPTTKLLFPVRRPPKSLVGVEDIISKAILNTQSDIAEIKLSREIYEMAKCLEHDRLSNYKLYPGVSCVNMLYDMILPLLNSHAVYLVFTKKTKNISTGICVSRNFYIPTWW